ncbi:uncharacterized protein LOC135216603 isoform X2 [Macrobrachium nipponense]|uniref:uncharacterized protein LOC135216603 isoform X2 n=1 Tax=Macrobrachium nipponense TaxID=159736 RepID=UPI0030C84049
MMKTIGIIGAGAAGLCGARHALAAAGMTPIVWEQSTKVGGTWVYTPELGKDKYGLPIHSSMYKNLKTNLPKETMAFPDFPFPDGEESFIHHTEVLKYLESYCDHFNIKPYIKFRHHVQEVSPVMKEESPPAWNVTVKDLETNVSSTTTCDALLICNGHYSIPRIPHIRNIDCFKGRKIHSHDYREPFLYKDDTVVILGAASSGLDICLEISGVARKVFLSHNQPVNHPSDFPANVEQVRGVVEATENGFNLMDGSHIEADVIMFCTGYEFSFPFLTKDCGITVEDNVVKPLYKHLIHSAYPSMAFIGIPFLVCPFPLFDFQVQFFLKFVGDLISLPSKMEMDEQTQKELEEKCGTGKPLKYFHKFGPIQWVYNNDLAALSGIPPLPPVVEKIYETVSDCRRAHLMEYKASCYKILGPDKFSRLK